MLNVCFVEGMCDESPKATVDCSTNAMDAARYLGMLDSEDGTERSCTPHIITDYQGW